MELGLLVGIAVIVWYFGRSMNSVAGIANDAIVRSADMASERMNSLVDEQTLITARKYSEYDIDAEVFASAQANRDMLRKMRKSFKSSTADEDKETE
jgi:hypothetical protein